MIEDYDVPNRMQCHSFWVETEAKALLYSADLGSFDDIAAHLEGLDYAVVESTHIDLEMLLDSARSMPAARFILSHLGEKADRSALAQRIADTRLTNVSLATDGLRLEM